MLSSSVNPLQFSGLATPAGTAACQKMGIFLHGEEESENLKAIPGFTGLEARKHIRRVMGDDRLTFSVPYRLFLEMEAEAENGLLDSPSWKTLTDPG